MAKLPVIVGFGGVNAAGRGSAHQAYRRLVVDKLDSASALQTWASMASLTGQLKLVNGKWTDGQSGAVDYHNYLTDLAPALARHSLIRKLEDNLFDPAQILFHHKASLGHSGSEAMEFLVPIKQLPKQLPAGWQICGENPGENKVRIRATDNFTVLLRNFRESKVNSAGQLPSGFDPATLYPSRNHPRGLQLALYSASDAIHSLGIDWETVTSKVPPDQISVYAGSGMSQLDYNGNGGMMQARLLGKKVTSKQLALGYAEMPADFINAYVLGNLGTTGTNVAACATFLYNLRQGLKDIQSGTHRVVVVGTSEAPLVPEIMDGFATMGALAGDADLRLLDGYGPEQEPDYTRACRPFANNAGFTLAESAQCVVLFDDELALELGATIHGAVNEVFVNADGFKKSIAGPGLGNYISIAKAAAATRNLIGEEGLTRRTYVQAHGTGTPQNRRTESHILDQLAATFDIDKLPVTAIKSYLGHSLASSAGDQLLSSLGVWDKGIIPGIKTTTALADDVFDEHLEFLLQHKEVGKEGMDAVLINSKGFGGNNATASVLAPHIAKKMLSRKHGSAAFSAYQKNNEAVQERAEAYNQSAIAGKNSVIYKFDHRVLEGENIHLSKSGISIDGVAQAISLEIPNNYTDMCD